MGKRHTTIHRPKGTLQIKILSGYLLLTLLVGGIVYAVWNEKQVFQEAEEEERAMLEQRRLTNSAFKSLIALLLYSDGALLWDKEDLRFYEEKDRRMSEILEKLGSVYSDTLQQSRIDTVRLLLDEKKAQIYRLAETPSTASRMDSLLSERLPSLEHSASVPERVAGTPENEGGKKVKRVSGTGSGPTRNRKRTGMPERMGRAPCVSCRTPAMCVTCGSSAMTCSPPSGSRRRCTMPFPTRWSAVTGC